MAAIHACRTTDMNRKAFTLLELLTVILIIAILATLAVPYYQDYIERSRAAEAVTVLRSLIDAQRTYYYEHAGYPDEMEALGIVPSTSAYRAFRHIDSGGYQATRTAVSAPPNVVG